MDLFGLFEGQVGFYYDFVCVVIIIIVLLLLSLLMMVMRLLEILLLLLPIRIKLVSPTIPLELLLFILKVILLADINLWLMIKVELLSLAFITLNRLL